LGLEFLQLSGHFSAAACQVRPSLIFKAVTTNTRFVSVVPASACCATSRFQSIGSPLSIGTVGVQKAFAILLKDAFGNSVPTCNEAVSLVHSGGPAQSSVDCRESIANFRPTFSGVYVVHGKLQSSASCELVGTKIIVKPFFRTFQQSSVKGTALTLATCGLPSWLTMTIRDMFRNPQPKSESPLIECSLNGTLAIQTNASPCPGVNCPQSMESTLDLRQYSKPEYVFSYVATLAGNFKLSIHSRDLAHVLGSPFTIQILPSTACASVSVSSGASLTIATNQNSVTFVISSRDTFGNAQADGYWISVVDSDVAKESAAASHAAGGSFQATNEAACSPSRCNIFSMLLTKNSLFAT
jgi:hypothetical protein